MLQSPPCKNWLSYFTLEGRVNHINRLCYHQQSRQWVDTIDHWLVIDHFAIYVRTTYFSTSSKISRETRDWVLYLVANLNGDSSFLSTPSSSGTSAPLFHELEKSFQQSPRSLVRLSSSSGTPKPDAKDPSSSTPHLPSTAPSSPIFPSAGAAVADAHHHGHHLQPSPVQPSSCSNTGTQNPLPLGSRLLPPAPPSPAVTPEVSTPLGVDHRSQVLGDAAKAEQLLQVLDQANFEVVVLQEDGSEQVYNIEVSLT